MGEQDIRQPDQVNHPSHYKNFSVEVIDMMFRIWGPEKFITYCEINAFKYRMRAGHKNDPQEDLAKAEKYMWFKSNVEDGRGPTDDRPNKQ